MLFIVGLSHVIAPWAAHIQVSFQQIQLRLCSKCPPLAFMHSWSPVKIICCSQGTVAPFAGEVDTFIIIWYNVSMKLCTPKITKISSFFTELFLKKSRCHRFFWNMVCQSSTTQAKVACMSCEWGVWGRLADSPTDPNQCHGLTFLHPPPDHWRKGVVPVSWTWTRDYFDATASNWNTSGHSRPLARSFV